MLVIMMENQLVTPSRVCQSCLLADKNGQPRWNSGQLICGRIIPKLIDTQPDLYECEMGFRIASI